MPPPLTPAQTRQCLDYALTELRIHRRAQQIIQQEFHRQIASKIKANIPITSHDLFLFQNLLAMPADVIVEGQGLKPE